MRPNRPLPLFYLRFINLNPDVVWSENSFDFSKKFWQLRENCPNMSVPCSTVKGLRVSSSCEHHADEYELKPSKIRCGFPNFSYS